MKPSLRTALGLLGSLSILAMLTLDGPLRGAVLLLFSALGLKVWIAELKKKQEAAERRGSAGGDDGANGGTTQDHQPPSTPTEGKRK